MQNFGRGMWRRVGDYDRVQKPLLLQQSRLEQWQQFVEYQTVLKRYQDIQRIRQQKLQTNINQHQDHISTDITNSTDIPDNSIDTNTNNIDDNTNNTLNQVTTEPPVVIPKKTKKKNKNK